MAKITSNYPGAETTDYMNTTSPSNGSPETAPAAKYSGGGALYAGGATIIRDSYFTNNSLLSYVDLWQPTADEATRRSQPQYSGGGAMYLTRNQDSSTSSDIFNTTFVDNFAQQVEANKDITRAGAQRQDTALFNPNTLLPIQAQSSATNDVTGDGSNDLVVGGISGLQVLSGGGNQSIGGAYTLSSANVGQVLTANFDNAAENEVMYLTSTGNSSNIRSAVNIRPGTPNFDSAGGATYTDATATVTETGIAGSSSARVVIYQLGGTNGTNINSRIIHSTITGTITAGATS
ncbi:MAG: hypothetical protein NTZ71_15145, partial [Planctomycetota bacterium]|nr:hypothetical protein [Planctomycetota bacterium]